MTRTGFPAAAEKDGARRFCVSRGVAVASRPFEWRLGARTTVAAVGRLPQQLEQAALPHGDRGQGARVLCEEQFQFEDKYTAQKIPLPSVSEPDANRFCLLKNCAFLRDRSFRRSRLGMNSELPNIVFGPWISDGGFLLRQVMGEVEERVLRHGGRLGGRMVLKASAGVGAEREGARIGPDIRLFRQ
jgi:hypothetical protein